MKRVASAIVLLLLGAAGAWSAGTVVHAVQTFTPVTHEFLTGLDATGALSAAQPAAADLTGTLPIANGGTGQTTAAAARASSSLNIDSATVVGDTDYTILSTDRTVVTSTSFSTTHIWTLPKANTVNPGQTITISDAAGALTSSNFLTLSKPGGTGSTIDGLATYLLNATNTSVTVMSDGVSLWSVVSSKRPQAAVTHQFLTSRQIATNGDFVGAQPACGDLSDSGSGCTGTLPVGANPTATAGASAVNGSAATFMRSDGAPALQAASAGTAGIAKLYSPVMGIGWVAGTDPANAIIAVANQALTIQAIIGVPEVALGAAATVDVYDAASGTACGAGTKVTTTAFDANGTAATNQALLSGTYALASGHRLCLQDTTGGTNFPSGNSVAAISVFANPS